MSEHKVTGLQKDPYLRAPVNRADAEVRNRLIERAIRAREEIQIDLNTVAYWNEYVRKPDEAEIDPDPDGSYAEMLAHLDRLIQKSVV